MELYSLCANNKLMEISFNKYGFRFYFSAENPYFNEIQNYSKSLNDLSFDEAQESLSAMFAETRTIMYADAIQLEKIPFRITVGRKMATCETLQQGCKPFITEDPVFIQHIYHTICCYYQFPETRERTLTVLMAMLMTDSIVKHKGLKVIENSER